MNQDIAVFLVPLVLVLGGVLLTAGGLYYIDIKFLQNGRQAAACLIGGVVIMALLQIILYGSASAFFNLQQLRTSSCELEGELAHPEARRGADAKVLHEAITGCMKEAGYTWTDEHRHCKDAPVATNPFCYLPTSGFDRAITSLQMNFQ